ncbi:MAG: hypothetical protein MZV49_10755 [Rhodopseudomonas palustris]|nr:hypothetical protein [Rhodopseudomonas palustris]
MGDKIEAKETGASGSAFPCVPGLRRRGRDRRRGARRSPARSAIRC